MERERIRPVASFDPNPNWMRPTFPRKCPYCGLQFMSFFKLGGHMTAHRREMVAGNQRAPPPPPRRRRRPPELEDRGGRKVASKRKEEEEMVVVPLGVLHGRIEVGPHLPKTLDLLGIGKKLLRDNEDDVLAAVEEEEDGNQRKRINI
ncbi:unnamed protein product [Spirodela intermedia]|uniref:C2H2-type domain-containing protein n=1 Tax=Spirodela intermedia TaxID=51605 RepID=A0A7I8JJ19_SPIIN|nr:unnamed protein product [Spirodela intermedia]CAA6670158.1 unnamed protein product [Spirodela intermedia]